MPINPSALGDPAPDPDPSTEAVAPDGTELGQSGGAREEEQPRRKRRTKAELIADAVVPGNNDSVELKDAGTGAKIQRPWLVAVEMIRDGKAEFADKTMKYAMLKYDQQKEENQGEPHDGAPSDPEGNAFVDAVKSANVPPDAQPGDEVEVNGEKLRVGHGGVLTTSPVAVDSTAAETNGDSGQGHDWSGAPESNDVEPVKIPDGVEITQVSERGWRIGTGILEKIGLPDYSSLQIGPITASREVQDDGRRTKVTIGEREALVPTATLDIAQQACDIVEYIARYQRGELVSFLESTGALKQPVS